MRSSVGRTEVIYRTRAGFEPMEYLEVNRRVHAANRKSAVIEVNRGIYFPRAASKLVYVGLWITGTLQEEIPINRRPKN